MPIGYIELRVFSHATEDMEKVLTAARNLFPEEVGEAMAFEKSALSGHHGNPIVLFKTKLKDRQMLPLVLRKIGAGLTSLDKELLGGELSLHLDKGNLFLRFDKQQAFLGSFRFSSNDPIHAKVHFKNRTTEEIIDLCREFGLVP